MKVDSQATPPDNAPIILIAEDDAANLESLERIFLKEKFKVLLARDGKEAQEQLRSERVQILLTDLMMPGLTGVDLLKVAKTISPETQVILMTAFGTVETAVLAMKEGAYDFITKPFKKNDLLRIVHKAMERQSLLVENRALKAQINQLQVTGKIIGNAPKMRQLIDVIHQVAPSEANVLIEGESGTGKELIARAVHDGSQRAREAFIPVNCAALPESIIESELFGYEAGAFTGATATKPGRFELANGGTIFLDEIGEVPLQIQVKLLRVLQEQSFERIGGTETIKVNVRIIAASNRNLKQEVIEKRFRDDLFYRLNVICISAPPLRDRKTDLPLLTEHFIARFCQKNNKAVRGISNQALDLLSSYDWPGNVRELENLIERAVVLCTGDIIDADSLPPEFYDNPQTARELVLPIGTPLEEIKAQVIEQTLKMTDGDKKLAAQLLGIATRTIYRKMN